MINTDLATVFWLDEKPISGSLLLDTARSTRQLATLVREIILNEELANTEIEPQLKDELLKKFRIDNNLENDEAYQNFLQSTQLTDMLFTNTLARGHKIIRYREERWGPRVNSLYLKHKDRYDMVTYRRLQSNNADVMQEVFFRLKDLEDSWETMASQFPGATPNVGALVGPVPVSEIEPAILEALRECNPGSVLRPISIQGQVFVVQLEKFEASKFDDKLRTQILRDEFENWLRDECSRMMSKLRYAQ